MICQADSYGHIPAKKVTMPELLIIPSATEKTVVSAETLSFGADEFNFSACDQAKTEKSITSGCPYLL